MANENQKKLIIKLPQNLSIDEKGYLYLKSSPEKESECLCNYLPALADYWTEQDEDGHKVDHVIFYLKIDNVRCDEKYSITLNSIRMLNFSGNGKCINIASNKKIMRQFDIIIRYSISEFSPKTILSYKRMGWTAYKNEPAYLAGNKLILKAGFIQNSNYCVSEELNSFTLDINESLSEKSAYQSTFKLMNIHSLAAPILIANTFLALVRSQLIKKQIVPEYSIYLEGTSGCGKSTLACLLGSIYNRQTELKFGLSDLLSTYPSLLKRINQYRDNVFIIDDLHRDETRASMNQIIEKLSKVLRLVGNNKGAEKIVGKDCSVLQPLAMIVCTCEFPMAVESTLSRCIWVKMAKPINFELASQAKMHPSDLSTCIYYYLRWFISNKESIEENLLSAFNELKERLSKFTSETRLANNYAVLSIGMHLFLKYGESLGFPRYYEFMEDFMKKLIYIIKKHDIEIQKLRQAAVQSDIDLVADISGLYNTKTLILVKEGHFFPATDDGIIKANELCLYPCKLVDKLKQMHPYCKITVKQIGRQLRDANLLFTDATKRSVKKIFGTYMFHIDRDGLRTYQQSEDILFY